MSIRHVTGSTDPVTTGIVRTGGGDKDASTVTVEGPVSLLETITDFSSLAPDGMQVENHTLETNGDGSGRLVIRCVNYGSGQVSTTPTRTTWRITMAEVQKPLRNHPHFGDSYGTARREIAMWLATEEMKRYDPQGNPQYVDSEENVHQLSGLTTDFCVAYEKGIETYVQHFPVIEKISYYKTLPGCSMIGNSTTSGTVSQFANNIDKWDVPAVTLSGFANTGWFKSGDNYEQGNDLVWMRHEQWTWTPDGSSSSTGWIYGSSST